jgi:hypothetical protein
MSGPVRGITLSLPNSWRDRCTERSGLVLNAASPQRRRWTEWKKRMQLLLTLELILGLLFIGVFGVSNIEKDLSRPPSRPMLDESDP